MNSILQFQAEGQQVPQESRQLIEQLIPMKKLDKGSCLINLYSPKEDSEQAFKWKWALLFSDIKQLNLFVEEVKESNKIQKRLGIEDYSVFGNVLFAFMKRQYKLNQWVQYAREVLNNQPMAVMIFNQRYKQLVELIQSNTSVYYYINWQYQQKPRQYKKTNSSCSDLLNRSTGNTKLESDNNSQRGKQNKKQPQIDMQQDQSDSQSSSLVLSQILTSMSSSSSFNRYKQKNGASNNKQQNSQNNVQSKNATYQHPQLLKIPHQNLVLNKKTQKSLQKLSSEIIHRVAELNLSFNKFTNILKQIDFD